MGKARVLHWDASLNISSKAFTEYFTSTLVPSKFPQLSNESKPWPYLCIVKDAPVNTGQVMPPRAVGAQLLQKWQDWDTWLICFSHQHSEQDLIHSMCPAHGPSSEELGSHFHILFLLLNQLCSFPTYLMTRHSSWNVWYSPSKDSQPSQQYSSGWQATVKPPPNSSLSLEFWGIGEIQTPDH